MKSNRFLSPLMGVLCACMFAATVVLSGCADSTTAPDANDDNAAVADATVNSSDPVAASEADSVRSNIARHQDDTLTIPMDQVIVIVLGEYPGAELLGVNLDYDRDSLNYECIVRSGGKIYVVTISPKDGRVIKKEEVTDDDSAYYEEVIVIRVITVKVKQAKDRAIKVVKGDVVECNLENVEGRPTYVIVILTPDNRYVTIYVDGETGKERKLKDKGECKDGDKHKNKKGRGHYRHGNGKGYGHRHHCHCECKDDDGNGGTDTTNVPTGIISVDSARAIVNASIDSLTISKVELKVENDSTAHYEIKASRDSNQYEIKLDAFTGAVTEIKQTAGDFLTNDYQPQVQGDTLVAMSVARLAAVTQRPGTIKSWKLNYSTSDTKWIYTFEIEATGTTEVKEVVVDAKTGAFIRIN
jgi:uncharacterized membrane protein YkoI